MLEALLEDVDDNQDYVDPDEPVMEGSDEFSDLELDEDETDAEVDLPTTAKVSPPVVPQHTRSTITTLTGSVYR